jgi:Tfp pilus assembly protein PilF
MEHEYAVMLHKTGQHDRAEDHFRRAVELCPTKGEYLYNLAEYQLI